MGLSLGHVTQCCNGVTPVCASPARPKRWGCKDDQASRAAEWLLVVVPGLLVGLLKVMQTDLDPDEDEASWADKGVVAPWKVPAAPLGGL